MDKHTRENWLKVLEALEAAGKTNCHIYRRAQAIVNGRPDPGPFGSLYSKS